MLLASGSKFLSLLLQPASVLKQVPVQDIRELYMVFGLRTCKEAETLNVEKPAKAFAPVKSIELQISGPKAEVDALKKKIDRKAFETLLGEVVK
jgi:hypothetical protein